MHEPLNLDDPLAETTRQRRLAAAYRRRGYTRVAFARELGVAYSSLRAWDLGLHTMPLDLFLRACELAGYSPSEISTGNKALPDADMPLLSDGALRAVLDELRASPAARTALAEHLASPAGKYQTVNRGYVSGFVAAWHAATTDAERANAPARAVNEQVDRAAVAAGVSAISDDDIKTLTARVAAELTRE